jgi:hypothetical protein
MAASAVTVALQLRAKPVAAVLVVRVELAMSVSPRPLVLPRPRARAVVPVVQAARVVHRPLVLLAPVASVALLAPAATAVWASRV